MNHPVSHTRGEMYDRDVQLIQFCAATLPPNTFILHCLNKFNLINWASKDFAVSEEESIRFLLGSPSLSVYYASLMHFLLNSLGNTSFKKNVFFRALPE